MAKKALAIIGGGASAILFLCHLLRRPSYRDFLIDVFDREARFAKGIAYSTLSSSHLLNVRTNMMSALADTPDDFTRFVAPLGYKPDDFVPRKIYADYLSEKWNDIRTALSPNLRKEDVLSCRKESEDAYVLETKGRKETYSHVLQATGNVFPLAPRIDGNIAGYYASPWNIDYVALVRQSHILCLGSGLSAVDTITALNDAGFRGRYSVLSRHGLFPAVHVSPASYPSFFEAMPRNTSPLEWLVEIRRRVEMNPDIPWQAITDSLRPYLNDIWKSWSEAEQKKFTSHLQTFWNVHRHRMAPQASMTIHDLRSRGMIEIIHDRAKQVKEGPSVIGDKGTYAADCIINCLGYRYAETGRVYQVSHKIGPACFGDVYETTAIPEIRAQAAKLAEDF